jgi:hypothetical protein
MIGFNPVRTCVPFQEDLEEANRAFQRGPVPFSDFVLGGVGFRRFLVT